MLVTGASTFPAAMGSTPSTETASTQAAMHPAASKETASATASAPEQAPSPTSAAAASAPPKMAPTATPPSQPAPSATSTTAPSATPPAPSAPSPAAAAPTLVKAGGLVPPESMNGVSFEGLSGAQRDLAVAILNEYGCDCSCGMKLAVCRRDDSKCGRSLPLARQVVELVKAGKGREEIVKSVLSPPSKFVQFALPPDDAPAIGPADAKVTILYYFDYQCPFCVRAGPTFDQIALDYPKDVRIVFKMHPLSIHSQARLGANAAMAAKAQGKFLEMHKKLFENSAQLSRDKVLALAKDIGLDLARFTKDLDGETFKATIDKEVNDVEGIGASGTPASFVNGRYVKGAKAYDFFKEMIDEELKWVRDGTRPVFTTGKNVSETMAPATAKTGPDPNKVYEIPAGNAPFAGTATAKVTILHYLDYQ